MAIAEYETATPTVLALGDATGAWIDAALERDCELRTVDGSEAAVATVEAETVDCVVVGADAGDDEGIQAVETLAAVDPALPILYVPPDDVAPCRTATVAGASACVPRTDGDEASLDRIVDAAVAEYDEHRQLRRERSMLHALLENAPQSIYFKDEAARVVGASSSFVNSWERDVLGKTDLEIMTESMDEATARETYADDLEVLETGESLLDQDEELELVSGETLWMRTSKYPWCEDGNRVGLVGLTYDVTGEKQREKERERERRRLEQFASYVSHDLRNPLSVASGNLEVALETGETERIETALDSLQRMERLLDDLLSVVTGDAGDATAEWVAIADVTRRSWEGLEAEGATLEVALPDSLEVRATRGGLRQLLENVLGNAVEHGSTSPPSQAREDAVEHGPSSPPSQAQGDAVDHGGSDVTVEVGQTPTGFYVADDGPGVDEAAGEDLFEHGVTTGGTGVGLTIAAEIAEVHRWEPRVTASAVGGARFEFNRAILRRGDRPDLVPGNAVALDGPVAIGDVAVEPEAHNTGEGAWTLVGGGRALWGTVEEYTAAFGTVGGDCRVEARLTDLGAAHDYSKAGVFIADAVEGGRPLGFVGATAEHGHEAAWRPEGDEPVVTRQIDDGDVLPRWYRVDRIGDRVTCYRSTDGEAWTPLDQHVLDLEEPVAAGILLNSHERGVAGEATFEDVRVVELDASG